MNITALGSYKTIFVIIVAVLLPGCTTTNTNLTPVAACQNLVLDYAYYRDQLDPESFGNLFAEDAELIVRGNRFQGRAAIKQRLIDEANTPITKHMMSTIRIFEESASSASGVSYVTVYAGTADNQAPLPQPVSGFAAVGAYHDKFVLTEDGWKIARREFIPTFRHAVGSE